jgi:4-amino-4-deoxy-L-arabinose transferase-like glycosyltransferase
MNQKRLLPWLGFGLVAVLFFSRISGFSFQDPDEGRYARIPQEMLGSGDWLTPTLAGVPYFEKPPLFYWLVAGAYSLLGENETGARVVPALAAFLTVWMTFSFGRYHFGQRAGLLAAGILATAPLFFIFSQAVVIDMVLTACFTATMFAFYRACEAQRKTPWILATVVAASLAILAKGLLGLVLPGAIAVLTLIFRRDTETLRALLRPAPIGLFLAITMPWFAMMAATHPDFLQYFLIENHFGRFLDAEGYGIAHPEGPWFYLPVLLLTPLPWSLAPFLLAGQRATRQALGLVRRDLLVFFLLWAGVVVLFFSASSSKLPPYVLPALPPLALLLGAWLDQALDEQLEENLLPRVLWPALLAIGLLFLLAATGTWLFGAILTSSFPGNDSEILAIRDAVFFAGLALTVGGLVWQRRRDSLLPVDLILLMILTVGAAELGAVSARSVAKSGRPAAEVLNSEAKPEDLIVMYRQLSQSLLFYADRRPIHLGDFVELTELVDLMPPADRDPWFWQGNEQVLEAWNSPRRVFLYINERNLAELEPELARPYRVLVRNRRRLLVDNQGAPGAIGGSGGSKMLEVDKIATDPAPNLAASSRDR